MSIRLTITLTDANTTINIPRDPVNGEWKTLKVLKVFHNINASTVSTNKAMFLNIEELENDGYIETSTGKLIRYSYAYFLGQSSVVEEIRMYSTITTLNFKNTKTDKLTISVANIDGDPPDPTDFGSGRYMILEVELNCGHKLSY
jgi:hypothetical protein